MFLREGSDILRLVMPHLMDEKITPFNVRSRILGRPAVTAVDEPQIICVDHHSEGCGPASIPPPAGPNAVPNG